MPQQSSVDRFFDAVDDAYDVLLDTLKAGVDRGHRVSKGLLEQVQEGQREAIELAATVAKAPTNISNTASATVATLTKTQGRVLQTSRQWMDEAMDSQQEGREALRKLIDANRQAGQAVIESSRGVVGQAQERARQVIRPSRDNSNRARAPKKTTETAKSE